MIRQAISCDICGAEKKQTNHWFVACEVGGELRVSGWNSRNRLRTGSKHLCGQVCLHKLADDFMARVISEKNGGKAQVIEEDFLPQAAADTSLTSPAAAERTPASLRLPIPPEPPRAPAPFRPELVLKPERLNAETPVPGPEQAPFGAANRRAEAWERERERAARAAAGRKPESLARRLSQAR